jgi:hypothetical protein
MRGGMLTCAECRDYAEYSLKDAAKDGTGILFSVKHHGSSIQIDILQCEVTG